MSDLPPIAVRGLAASSCFGRGAAAHVEALKHGRSGLKPLAPGHGLGALTAGLMLESDQTSERRPFTVTEQVLGDVIENAKLTEAECAETAVFAGTTTGIAASEEIAYLRDRSLGARWKAEFQCGGPGRLSAFAAQAFGSKGPCFTHTTACTSSAVGAVMAARLIRQGRIRRAVVLGLDLMMKMSLEGFRLLQLYSENGCRPFDARRDGLQLGEACAAVVLEAGPGRFQFLDGAIRHDPGHIAAGSSDGRTGSSVMNEAIARSQRTPADITAVKAHGTGTVANDLTELRALQLTFGPKPPPFTSLKSAFGHTLGASSALELASWLWCVEQGFTPGTHGFNAVDPALPVAPQIEPRPLATKGPSVHLFNSFGFGGTSVSFAVEARGGAA